MDILNIKGVNFMEKTLDEYIKESNIRLLNISRDEERFKDFAKNHATMKFIEKNIGSIFVFNIITFLGIFAQFFTSQFLLFVPFVFLHAAFALYSLYKRSVRNIFISNALCFISIVGVLQTSIVTPIVAINILLGFAAVLLIKEETMKDLYGYPYFNENLTKQNEILNEQVQQRKYVDEPLDIPKNFDTKAEMDELKLNISSDEIESISKLKIDDRKKNVRVNLESFKDEKTFLPLVSDMLE